MAKDTIVQYSTTAGSNTDVQSVNIAEACPPSGINNAIREIMVDLAELSSGAQSLANLKTTATTQIAAGAVGAPSLSFSADLNTGIWQSAADSLSVSAGGVEKWRFGSNPLPGRNLFINGAMNVAQRSASVADVGGSSGYVVHDRIIFSNSGGTGRYTVSQTADGPVGFANCIKVDCTTADSSLDAAVLNRIEARLEAQNFMHLAYGNAAAKTLTLSFYVKCTSTGTLSVLLQQQDGGRSYHQNYTIDATDTWERKTLVFTGDASGGMNDDNGIGFSVYWTLAAGSDFKGGTSGSWATHGNTLYGTGDDLNVLGNTATNWFITGIQLEVGGVATDFEHEDFGTTLAKCLRYYERITGDVSSQIVGVGVCRSTTNCSQIPFHYAVKRAVPTLTVNSVSAYDIISSSAGGVATSNLTAQQLSTRSVAFAAPVASGLTDGRPGALDMDADEFFEISAEL